MAEVEFCVRMDEVIAERIVAALCADGQYQPTIDGEPNPMTPFEFARQNEIERLLRVAAQHEANGAAEQARAEAHAKARRELVIT